MSRPVKNVTRLGDRTKSMGPVHQVGARVLTRKYSGEKGSPTKMEHPGVVVGHATRAEPGGFGRRELLHRVKLDSGGHSEDFSMNMKTDNHRGFKNLGHKESSR